MIRKEMLSTYGSVTLFPIYLFVACYGSISVVPVVNSLSTPAVLPPSNNPDVLRSYILRGDDAADARGWELLSPSVLPDQDEEEDEVEYWYPTRRRYFEFSIPSASSSSSSSSSSPVDCTTATATTTTTTTTTTMIRQTSFGCGKLGGEVWDSSVALCLYLGQQNLVKDRRILELGSGCGLPSVVCRDELQADAVLATDFWQTDDDDFDKDRLVPTKFHGMNLEYNVVIANNNDNDNDNNDNDRTRAVETAVQRLDWHDRASAASARTSFRPDLVIGSDLVYYPMDVEPLLNVLEVLLLGNGNDNGDGDGDGGEDDDNNNKESLSPPPENKTRAVLVLPLAPAEREALPEFRSKLPSRFSATHTVKIEEMDLIREDTNGEDSRYLTIDITPK